MAGLGINGIEAPVLLDSVRQLEPERLGDRGRSALGTAFDSVRERKWGGIRARLKALTPSESEAWRGLIEGRGDAWRFENNTLSVRGLAATSGAEALYGVGSLTGHGRYGAVTGYSGATARVTWTTATVSTWTLIYSAYNPVPQWRRYMLRSDGAKFSQGVRDDTIRIRTIGYSAGTLWQQAPQYGGSAWAALSPVLLGAVTVGNTGTWECIVPGNTGAAPPAWPAPTSGNYGTTLVDGSVTWRLEGTNYGYLGDLAFVPYAIPDSWAPSVYAEDLARPWTMPYLRATGSLVPQAPRTVVGRVTGCSPVAFMSGGALQAAGESIEFEIREA